MANAPAVVAPQTNIVAGNRARGIYPQSYAECVQIAGAAIRAGVAPKSIDTPEKATIAIMCGAEVGIGPMASLQSIAVINGMPGLYGDGLLGVVRGSGLLEDIIEEQIEDDDGVCTVARCRVKRKGEASWGEQVITAAFCAKAGWLNKAGPWTLTRKRMMQLRARGWALRDKFADVTKGLRPAEEIEDMVDVTAQGSATTTPPEPKRSDFAATGSSPPTPETETISAGTSAVAEAQVPTPEEPMPAKSWEVKPAQPGEEPKRLAILDLLELAETPDEVDDIARCHGEFLSKLGRTKSETQRAFNDRRIVLGGQARQPQ